MLLTFKRNKAKICTYYKSCMVASCTNTTKTTPNKIFIAVPRNERRKIWLEAAGREVEAFSTQSRCYCCEDHFDLENDMDNYMQYKITGCIKRMKRNVVPSKFDCQKDRKITHRKLERSVTEKKVEIVNELSLPTTSGTEYADRSAAKNYELSVAEETQVFNKSTRDIQTSPVKLHINTLTSPIQLFNSMETQNDRENSNIVLDATDNSSLLSVRLSSLNTLESNIHKSAVEISRKQILFRAMMLKIEKRPTIYLGIPHHFLDLLCILQKCVRTALIDIVIVLKKIKTDNTYLELSDDFGLSENIVCRIFSKTLRKLSACLKKLIFWQFKTKITKNVPIYFRARYANVQTIIHCFEIQIEKPIDPVKQSLTWSDNKKCNTCKYLISCSPDGIINFISNGFGGRTSDTEIVENSNYLEFLQTNSVVMADRGFKHVEHLITSLNCKLIRPPSVAADSKIAKCDVLLTKKIASLRIHVERLIRRIREFKMLRPHSVVNNKLIDKLDHIVYIVCGLINLQCEYLFIK